MKNRMPALFLGHGNPMNALAKNGYTEAWAAIGKSLPRPQAILAVSAHWYVPFTGVTANRMPRTIHDFGGFPKELYQVQYPAPGSPELARQVKEMLPAVSVQLDESWGLDHGTWSVLKHVFPKADIPVVQLSIDETQPPAFHAALGRKLAPLRDEGILVVGSGNIVHNLMAYAWGTREAPVFDWASRFEAHVRKLLIAGDDAPLVNYLEFGDDAALSAPTPDHYLPFLYVLGLRQGNEPVRFPVQGVDGGAISMLAVQFG